MSEAYEYPKKPESEHRFNEFLATGKQIEALQKALKDVGAKSLDEGSDDSTVYIENDDQPQERPQKTRVEMEMELGEAVKRYEELRGILGSEANPPEEEKEAGSP